MTNITKVMKCDNCPILFRDEIYDPSCKLGFTVFWNGKYNSEEYYSDNCELEVVRFSGKEFHPESRPFNEVICTCENKPRMNGISSLCPRCGLLRREV